MINSPEDFQRPFFIGIAGSGMSAIAQYLKGVGKEVSGSDRFLRRMNPMTLNKNSKQKVFYVSRRMVRVLIRGLTL